MNKELANIAKTYKRKVAGGFMLIEGAKLMDKIGGEDYCVTRKIDGTMQILFYRDGEVSAYSTNGVERRELPCLKEFAQLAGQAGYKSITIAAELYATIRSEGRERVGDVATALSDGQLLDKLHLAPFDILDVEGEEYTASHYKETLALLNQQFSGSLVKPVEGRLATSKQEVMQIYQQWVDEEGAEGLVVHSELPITYKVKPRHSIDAVIIGYTVGENENEHAVRDLLLAVMRGDGVLQQFGATGNGLSQEQRTQLYAQLSQMNAESDYFHTDSRNMAFQMVRPEVVVEVTVIDFAAENAAGEAKMNMLLDYDANRGYTVRASSAGVAAHSMVFERIRDDKSANATDIRLSQITDLCAFSQEKTISMSDLPTSELLVRRVFTKGKGDKFAVQKYLVWKTNKEESGMFPAYVLHYTDLSLGRKDPLKRDLRVSSSREQIMQLLDDMLASNIKKGWNEVAA